MFASVLVKLQKCFFFFTLLVLYSLQPVVFASEMQEYNFGSISISIPSNWYVHDKKSVMAIVEKAKKASNGFNSQKKRLLVANDQQYHPEVIVRLSSLPADRGLLSAIQEINQASLKDRSLWAKEFSQEFGNNVIVRRLYPIEVAFIGLDQVPAMLIHYDRAGTIDAHETWYVCIYQFCGQYNNYLLTVSYNRDNKIAPKILTKVKNSIREIP